MGPLSLGRRRVWTLLVRGTLAGRRDVRQSEIVADEEERVPFRTVPEKRIRFWRTVALYGNGWPLQPSGRYATDDAPAATLLDVAPRLER